MDAKTLFLHHANELGLPMEIGLSLYNALEPLCNSLSNVMDLGLYFHSVTRCEAECIRHELAAECGVLLWSVSASLRGQIQGSIAVDYVSMKRKLCPNRVLPFRLLNRSHCLVVK